MSFRKDLLLPLKEPLECYHVADIEAGLGLKRKHLIAVSLLVGSEQYLSGVQGIGLDTALRFVKCFNEEEILDRLMFNYMCTCILSFTSVLNKIAKGDPLVIQGNIESGGELARSSNENSPKPNYPHCSHCGHPGNKRLISNFLVNIAVRMLARVAGRRSVGFKCVCSSCDFLGLYSCVVVLF
ncbi:flap endonuclease GEN-like 1 isoform X1 [Primulina tabacum]|uniref:flap endonuclease GEN-like 1 isoform X1 n=1 Tax=Primulina tabacum TaxID=48773 RepID=UPI003F5AD635